MCVLQWTNDDRTGSIPVKSGKIRPNSLRAIGQHGRNEPMENKWLSVDEIAKYLGISKDTVYAWISNRELPAHRVGRFWKFQLTEVDAWVRSGKAGNEDDETKEK